MVRKTKEDAELTRLRILDAARSVFLKRGVSKSTLEHIASEANVTRGAVYWHFKNKTEIFHAIRDQVFLPLIDSIDDTLSPAVKNILSPAVKVIDNPLNQIEASLCNTVNQLNDNQQMREIYEIMMIKCEYVDEFATVLHQMMKNCACIEEKLEAAYVRAKEQNLLGTPLSPRALALDTHLFFGGLLHMWVKDADGSRFRFQAQELIKSHVDLRRR
ncbi:MAG: TetR family transcriptional regulator [Methylotenera sp. 17-45-7]|jgi:TetR/AcrR family acrAB operon transcriptional repressor|nr:MAG: TetR family transcriptional regulator [Methylotenera sp. 17-45-7]